MREAFSAVYICVQTNVVRCSVGTGVSAPWELFDPCASLGSGAISPGGVASGIRLDVRLLNGVASRGSKDSGGGGIPFVCGSQAIPGFPKRWCST
jgi:hypothetical protein